MINFTREVVISKSYDVTLEEFMRVYYSGADIDHSDPDLLLIYVHNSINTHCMSYVFSVPYIRGKDIYNEVDVKFMIAKKFEGEK